MRNHNLLSLFLSVGLLCSINTANAACTIEGGIISSNCSGLTVWTSGNLTINEGVNINGQIEKRIPSGSGITFTNNGSIGQLDGTPFYNLTGTSVIDSFINNGVLGYSGNGSGTINAIYLRPLGGGITSLTNNGSMINGNVAPAIYNDGSVITTLNNAQGIGNSFGALTYRGDLPTNYNIIISGSGNYGQLLSDGSVSGSTAFGIYPGSSITTKLYTGVLQGLTTSNVGATRSGIYGNFNWALALQNGSSTIWDLIFSGASTADTQASLNSQARRLRSAFNSTMASANFANMNTYDCNLFDQNNMCISAGGRYTSIDNPSSNHSAAVVVLGHKISPHIRIGGFLDQSVNHNMPSGVDMSNKNPMMGAFAVWNHQADGLGFQMKLANAYLDKDVTTSRAVIGTSEAGRGRTDLNTQSYVGELSYAFNYQDSTIVRPYFAVRYTNIKQDGYTEDTTTSVTAPLTYAKLSDRSTTALMGVKLNHALTPRTNLTASLGIEQDLYHKTDQLVASGVADLTSENFNNNIKRTRPVASAGAYYAVAKNQRLSGEVYYQQLPFQSTGSATAYVNYMIGF
jgi:Autotransporter beta-domain